ncbi:MAG: hypothetical protein M3O06_10940 [Pseudomonadota bacterium]|nr:hypothetical protein [Pseudomonadota bacterium]
MTPAVSSAVPEHDTHALIDFWPAGIGGRGDGEGDGDGPGEGDGEGEGDGDGGGALT